MKTKLFFFGLLCFNLSFGQNNSNGTVGNTLANSNLLNPLLTIPQTAEAFRFRSGLVTQLDLGNNFDLSPTSPLNSRWFSIGSLNTGSQTVYGLRFQDRNKGVVFGYEDIANPNPRIQWIGQDGGLGNFEFRAASSFNSTQSQLVASMTSDGKTIFGDLGTANNIYKVTVVSDQGFGLNVRSTVNAGSPAFSFGQGLNVIQNSASSANTGASFNGSDGTSANVGVSANASGGQTATAIFANVSNSNRSIGVRGSTQSGVTFRAGVYGETPSGTNQFAGYFDGRLFATGLINSSDKKLKQNIKIEQSALEKISQLKPVVYDYIKISEVNLPTGTQHGFIAQELAEVFPELTEDVLKPVFDEAGTFVSDYQFKSINYIGLISILTAGINELKLNQYN